LIILKLDISSLYATNLTRLSENFSSNSSRFMSLPRSSAASNCNSWMAAAG